MFEIEEKTLEIAGLQIAYTQVGDPNGRVLVCVHGLLSNGRDYDFLAQAMAQRGYCVVSIDLPGRGRSAWFTDKAQYSFAAYFPYVTGVIDYVTGGKPFDFFGASLGGMIGMVLAAGNMLKMERLILVDIGAVIPRNGLKKVSVLAKSKSDFPTQEQAIDFLKMRCAAWGITQDATWAHLIAHNIVQDDNGGYCMHYDPAIGAAMPDWVWTIRLWKVWYGVKCPVLLVRGGKSELITAKIAKKMAKYYKGSDFHEIAFEECGHVPNLMEEAQIDALSGWLGLTRIDSYY